MILIKDSYGHYRNYSDKCDYESAYIAYYIKYDTCRYHFVIVDNCSGHSRAVVDYFDVSACHDKQGAVTQLFEYCEKKGYRSVVVR